jgi:apolipoprotein D and lipocalin family protein
MQRFVTGAVLALLTLAAPAMAAAPQPVKAAPAQMFSGRWYQIARIAAADPHPCHAATDDFLPAADGGFAVSISCRDAGGRLKQMTVKGKTLPGSSGAKFRVSFLGGLFHQDYWILDHASNNAWALMATPGGRYLWLLARTPALAADQRADATQAMRSLGYDVAQLVAER